MWKDLVKTVAPLLGTALGGPMGGMATKWLAGALLGDEDAGENALEQVILNASPDIMLKIKEMESNFKIKMKELGITEEQLHAKDRDSARKMAIQTTLLPQIIISIIFIIAFSSILYTVFNKVLVMDETQKNIMIYLLGILSAGMIQVMNFWFGSSSGSKEKTAKLGIK